MPKTTYRRKGLFCLTAPEYQSSNGGDSVAAGGRNISRKRELRINILNTSTKQTVQTGRLSPASETKTAVLHHQWLTFTVFTLASERGWLFIDLLTQALS
ncbi:hypothetical protein STEG23_014089, partial [Scotinomys teguina]